MQQAFEIAAKIIYRRGEHTWAAVMPCLAAMACTAPFCSTGLLSNSWPRYCVPRLEYATYWMRCDWQKRSTAVSCAKRSECRCTTAGGTCDQVCSSTSCCKSKLLTPAQGKNASHCRMHWCPSARPMQSRTVSLVAGDTSKCPAHSCLDTPAHPCSNTPT
jgi:hypothetical protein